MAQEIECLPLKWEFQMEILAPGFGPQRAEVVAGVFRSEQRMETLSLRQIKTKISSHSKDS